MAILKLITGKDNPILRAKNEEIKKVDKKLRKLVKDMIETMVMSNGIGLAAPQVGQNTRLIVVTIFKNKKSYSYLPMINPKLSEFSEETDEKEEGCLCLPGVFGKVCRSLSVEVGFMNLEGKQEKLKLEGINARIVQHEADHLEGVLFVDKLVE